MSKTILYIATSLDGFIAGKNDDLSWLDPYNDVDYGFPQFFSRIGAIIEGRRTYDVTEKLGFANAHKVPHLIVSHGTPSKVPEGMEATFVQGDAADILKQAKRRTSKDVWVVGGAQIARQFFAQGLIDEFILTLVPVLLGDGIRLFDHGGSPAGCSLQGVKTFDKGLVQSTYGMES